MVVIAKLLVGFFMLLIGLGLTTFAVGEKQLLYKKTNSQNIRARLFYIVWVMIFVWVITSGILTLLWSYWFASVIVTVILFGFTVHFGTHKQNDDIETHNEIDTIEITEYISRYLELGMRWSYDTLHAYVKEQIPQATDEQIETAYHMAQDTDVKKNLNELQHQKDKLDQLITGKQSTERELSPPLLILWMKKCIDAEIDSFKIERLLISKKVNEGRLLSVQEEATVITLKQEFDDTLSQLDTAIDKYSSRRSDVEPIVVADLVEAIWFYDYYLQRKECYSKEGSQWSYTKLRFELQAQMPVTDAEIQAAYIIASDTKMIVLFEKMMQARDELNKYIHWPYRNDMLGIFELIGQSRRKCESRARNLYSSFITIRE